MTGSGNPVQTVLVGAGFVGKLHLLAAAGLSELQYVAAVDSDPDALARIKKEFGLPGYPSLRAALNSHRLEAVDLCAPTYLRVALIEEAAELGLHILCEKPLALSLEGVSSICAILARTGVRLMVAEVIRFWPEYAAALDIARSGQFGAVTAVHLQRLASPPPFNSWMVESELGGGAVVDLQIHDFSFLLQLLGPPSTISPLGKRAPSMNDAWNALDYGEGPYVTNRASFTMPASYVFRATFLIEMEGGVLDMDDWRPAEEKLLLFPAEGSRACPVVGAPNPFREELAYFGRQIRSGEPFDLIPLEESIMSLRMCLATWEAQRIGGAVALEQDGPAAAGTGTFSAKGPLASPS
jgi:predicted dehydrogenase